MAVASILTLTHKRSMVYKYGCSDTAFNRLGGTALLFWSAIQEAKDRGLDELEMGRSDVDNLGLIAFKEHWGATPSPVTYWTHPNMGTGLPGVLKTKFARHVVGNAPDIVLKTIGRLLYKHVG
jgi:hypothetical protein